jgi:hypothetical protein
MGLDAGGNPWPVRTQGDWEGCIPGDVCILPPLLKSLGPGYGSVKCGVIDLG